MDAFLDGEGSPVGDPLTGGVALIQGAGGPHLSSAAAPWRDVVRVEQHRFAAGRWHRGTGCGSLIYLPLEDAGVVECRLPDGRTASVAMSAQVRCVLAAGTALVWRQEKDAVAVVAAPDACLLSRIGAVGDRAGRTDPARSIAYGDRGLEAILLALRAEMAADYPGGRLCGEALAAALATRLVRLEADPIGGGAGLPPGRLRKVRAYIEANLNGDVSVQRLAGVAQMSARQFARLFTRSTGLPPHRYVLRQRVDTAKRLLEDEQASLAEISYVLGFPNQAHFTNTFRKIVGTTPKQYRDASR